ncbi:cyclase family protein [Paenibacillus sp. FSL R7-0652]|jgi:kynurenine formamidase|uniref:cyclase family protein n=1 Tax=Paenibacillus sp. FSL R7-0652 TaxID=2921687 RepID=UPI003159D90E
MKRLLLSYPLGVHTPVYKDNPPVVIEQQSSIDQGDPYNQFIISSLNHNGTHIDAPWHFNPKGRKISEIPIDEFIFTHPVIIDIPKRDDELITKADLVPYEHQIAGADLLLIRTGFGSIRSSDPERYANHNPGLSASAAQYLMIFDSLRAIGIDMISAGAANHPEEAVAFHQTILGKGRVDGRYVMVIEDLNLNQDLSNIHKVYAIPLYIEGVDSSFATVFTED